MMESDKSKIINALGGKRGLLDSGLPSLVFLIAYNIGHGLKDATIAALITSALLTLIRLIRRDTLQHVLSGFVGVAFCALLARKTGHAVDFYLPGLIINVVYGTAYAIFNFIGLPIIGLLLGPILGENLSWRKVPERKRAYTRAGWLWVALFLSRLIVQYPLYRAGNINALGTARLVMGYPLFLLAAWGSWVVLRGVPSVKPEQV
jgi:intracellular septation protein A